jgi:hypothetical protein
METELKIAVSAHYYCNAASEANIYPSGMLHPNIHKGLILISARIMTKSS